jgi:hypothetical protein
MPYSGKPLQMGAESWCEIRNAIARDNREIPIHQLRQAITIRKPMIDAVVTLPEEFLNVLYEYYTRGTLQEVLHKAFSEIPQPPPRELIEIDVSTKPVENSIGEGVGVQISPEEGLRRLLEAAESISLDERLGHLCDSAEIERLLGIPRRNLQTWHRRNLIVSFKDDRGEYLYPLEQFADAKPVDGMREVLQIIRYTYTAWTWLIRPKPSIGGVPLDLLKRGKLYDVLEAAERDFG